MLRDLEDLIFSHRLSAGCVRVSYMEAISYHVHSTYEGKLWLDTWFSYVWRDVRWYHAQLEMETAYLEIFRICPPFFMFTEYANDAVTGATNYVAIWHCRYCPNRYRRMYDNL